MQPIVSTLFLVYVCFLLEIVWANILGPWAVPNLLLIFIVFINLYRGTRYSLIAAVFGGILKDSFGSGAFGLFTVAFLACAYAITILKVYLYSAGSMGSRVLMVFVTANLNVALVYLLNRMSEPLDVPSVFFYVLVPEVFLTTLLSPYVFGKLKRCASRLYS